ncbi:sensor histidine kinase [Aquimarina mytili]|uniref:Histidine kinase n=1 Tax=Aquimarina mytili TaxID=874423 RepID=A0A936ZND5_9FLAO|nr:histidine kinase [Aquimarina mytili]MBL0682442.1 histidine kinase [Aquimarina mytili]
MKSEQIINTVSSNNFFSKKIIKHILYWIGMVVFFGITWGTYDHDYQRSFLIQFFGLPGKIVLVYITLLFLIPKFFVTRKFTLFAIFYFLTLVLTTIIVQRPIMLYHVEPNYLPGWSSKGFFAINEIMKTALDVNNAAILPMAYIFFKFYYNSQQKTLTLEKEKLEAELNQLRNQVHPHFLFNTLNNLYSLIIQKSSNAEAAVLKLSGLMRYMLYEANVPKVPISKEIEYLKNYVDLEKLRFDDQMDISFNTETDKEYIISPFLLIPFVENAFKHGSNLQDGSWIVISIFVKKNNLIMKVENAKSPNTLQNENSEGGIGFSNVKKRLELLYKNKYTLQTEDTGLSYESILKLNLETNDN